jgi:hypothetical protein
MQIIWFELIYFLSFIQVIISKYWYLCSGTLIIKFQKNFTTRKKFIEYNIILVFNYLLMKKFLSVILATILILTFTSCMKQEKTAKQGDRVLVHYL